MNKHTPSVTVVVDGKEYPCYPTMGAMLRFKQQTGREITEMDPASFSDLCTYLHCCVASASRREGKEFDMSLMDFADALTPDQMTQWQRSAFSTQEDAEAGADADGDEKKSPQESQS